MATASPPSFLNQGSWAAALLESALWYAARGWPVVPCHTPTSMGGCSCKKGQACESIGKHPRTLHGLYDASTDPAVIERWWSMWPEANIAIVTGHRSGLVALDEDSYKGGDESLAELIKSYHALPETVQQLTGGGGVQYLFTSPAHPVGNSASALGQGLDVRGDGGYIIAPPSLHVSGKRYQWELSYHPEETPLAAWPDWLDALCKDKSHNAHDRLDPAAPILETRRNDTLFRLGCSLRARGFSVTAIHAALLAMNDEQCVPPLTRHEVEGIARSCGRYESGAVPADPFELLTEAPEPVVRQREQQAPQSFNFHACPPLPETLRQDRTGMRTWLDEYVTHSAYWAPRAAPSYHAAVGLWVLSTIAARRIVCRMGSRDVYPTLFLALVSHSGLWTKTEAASIGVKMLRRSGCGHLLAPDRTTPQFLLKLMSGIVPNNYGSKHEDEQEQMRAALGFAAQRGWFYEEWGNMLKQMKRVDSPQAELNKLLIVLEGGAETFETGTIQRGLERVVNPYLALLGCATPSDLGPFMGEGDAWWSDGFWPRFAFASPGPEAMPSLQPRPREAHTIPASLIIPLADWHARLGSPEVTIEEERESNGKLTGQWRATISQLPCHDLQITPDVYDAYEAYNRAIMTMVHANLIPPDLCAWYVRAHEKALRVAMLLASVQGETQLSMPYWLEGQAMVEQWRHGLHNLIAEVEKQAPLGKEARLEGRILACLMRAGGMTKRELQQHIYGVPSDLLVKTLESMVRAEKITVAKNGKKILYLLYQDQLEDHADEV